MILVKEVNSIYFLFLLHTFTTYLLDIIICLCNNTHNKEQIFIKGSKMFEMTYTKPQIASLMNIRIETYEGLQENRTV